MDIVKDAKLMAIFGMRGMGKSAITKKLLRDHKRVVVFDPQEEYGSLPGFRRVDSYAALDAAIRAGWVRGYRIAYCPGYKFHPQKLSDICEMLYQFQAGYGVTHGNKICLIVEEMNTSYPHHQLPGHCQGMNAVILQGRHRGLEAIGIAQRPALIHRNYRSNAEEGYCFMLGEPKDFQAVGEKFPEKHHREIVARLAKYDYIRWSNGVVSFAPKGKNEKVLT